MFNHSISLTMAKVLPVGSVQLQRRTYCVLVGFFIALVIYFNVYHRRQTINIFTYTKISENNDNTNVGIFRDNFLATETNQTLRKIYSCYHKYRDGINVELLEDIQLSKRQPKLDTTIFFVITTCLADNLVEIRKRQACAIESAARHNPDRDIFIVFASPAGFGGDSDAGLSDRLVFIPKIIKMLSYFPNIHLRNINMTTFIHDTPMEILEQNATVYRSYWPAVHLADVIRMLILYKYGGIYLDSDVIVMKSFRELYPVFISSEESDFLNNGAMGTTHDGFGHEFFQEMIIEGARRYNHTIWGTIGRDMIAECMMRKCKMSKIGDDNSACPEMKIYPQNMFHPFAWADDEAVWNITETNQLMMDRIKDSLMIHLWSSRSKVWDLKITDKSVINVVASKNCPKMYNLDNHFNY